VCGGDGRQCRPLARTAIVCGGDGRRRRGASVVGEQRVVVAK
jgi:hypothetical protein